ncbi:uncharacterized protein FRV6_11729 [Fusarium oxysporum]|uniref:Uncharacterized protein n=1 Tax=Fusarium oxysporum TaxID=5507 RepID=A0A2H3TG15_FUSOX|nr:uncharacterized protein FRV6_11729 [Fusarium oxysporum]
MTEPETPHVGTLLQTIAEGWGGVQAIDAPRRISRLAANIGKTMPEFYPGEHLQTAQVLVTSSGIESMIDCLKIVIYQISNNAINQLWDDQQWEATFDLFSRAGLLYTALDLKGVRERSLTVRAFMDNLFRAAINAVTGGILSTKNKTREIAPGLIKWLLSSGQDPNICMHNVTPLERAVIAAQPDLTELLLIAGANPDRACKWSGHRSLMDLALALRPSDNKLRIIKLLLPHTIKRGPSLLASTVKAKYPFYHNTALNVAAMVDIDTTASILRHIEVQYPSRPTSAFITPDVFIAATSAGNTDVILFLHGVNPIGGSPNLNLITPLQVAVSRGHLGTCQLLLQLYGGLSAALIYIACYYGHLGLLQYLLQNGLSVNEPMASKDAQACRALCRGFVGVNVSSGQPVTALQYLWAYWTFNPWYIRLDPRHDCLGLLPDCLFSPPGSLRSPLYCLGSPPNCLSSPPDWLELLIGRGAMLPEGSVISFATIWWDKALLAALDASGSANETNPNAKQLATIKILLERGAQLRGGEVFQAMRRRHLDLVLLLLHHRARLLDTHENRGPTLDAAIMLNDDKLLERVVAELPGYYDAGSLCAAKVEADRLEGTAVGLAAESGDIQLVRKLLEHLGKPDSALLPFRIEDDGLWEFNCRSNFWRDKFQKLIESSPLALAVSEGFSVSEEDTKGFSELLENGYRPDRLTWLRVQRLDGVPPHPLERMPLLSRCIGGEDKELLHYLLKAGADANEHNRTHIARWGGNRSPLLMAVEFGNLDIIDLLLQAGAYINAPPSFFRGATALQIAAIEGNLGLAKQLLDLGARINARGARQCGRTVLEGAAEHGRLDMLQLLLHSGALTTGARQLQFIRAVHFAEQSRHDAAADLLRQSRQWTDEDADLYEKRSPRCGDSCFEEFLFDDGQLGWICLDDENGRAHCCDEIHSAGDECIHDYIEIEDMWYTDRAREMDASKSGESYDELDACEEPVNGSDEDLL